MFVLSLQRFTNAKGSPETTWGLERSVVPSWKWRRWTTSPLPPLKVRSSYRWSEGSETKLLSDRRVKHRQQLPTQTQPPALRQPTSCHSTYHPAEALPYLPRQVSGRPSCYLAATFRCPAQPPFRVELAAEGRRRKCSHLTSVVANQRSEQQSTCGGLAAAISCVWSSTRLPRRQLMLDGSLKKTKTKQKRR